MIAVDGDGGTVTILDEAAQAAAANVAPADALNRSYRIGERSSGVTTSPNEKGGHEQTFDLGAKLTAMLDKPEMDALLLKKLTEAKEAELPEIITHQCSMCGAMNRIPRPQRDRYKVICANEDCGHEDEI